MPLWGFAQAKGNAEEDSRYRFFDPLHVPHKRAFRSTVIEFMGRRGQGKTLAATCYAKGQHNRFAAVRYPWKIVSNYKLMFPGHAIIEDGTTPPGCPYDLERVYYGELIHYRGMGYPRKTLCGLEGERAFEPTPDKEVECARCIELSHGTERCPVDVLCHPLVMDALLEYPKAAREMTLCLDELQTAFPGRRSLAGINLLFSNMLTQIRKRKIECLFTTQFPQVLDVQVLLQVDYFIRCNMLHSRRMLALEHYDYWGTDTGHDYRKRWPPQPGTHDWESAIYNVHKVWGEYDSDEVIPPAWFKGRESVLKQQGWNLADYTEIAEEGGRQAIQKPEDLPAPYEDSEAEQARVAQQGNSLGPDAARLKVHLQKLGEPFKIMDQLQAARRHLPSIRSVEDFGRWLLNNGFQVWEEKGEGFWAQEIGGN